jgi:hypothetical protein
MSHTPTICDQCERSRQSSGQEVLCWTVTSGDEHDPRSVGLRLLVYRDEVRTEVSHAEVCGLENLSVYFPNGSAFIRPFGSKWGGRLS